MKQVDALRGAMFVAPLELVSPGLDLAVETGPRIAIRMSNCPSDPPLSVVAQQAHLTYIGFLAPYWEVPPRSGANSGVLLHVCSA